MPTNPAADVLFVPYDFRHSIAVAAEYLNTVIEDRRGDRKVIVVAHSMGGLVARYWLSVLGGWRVCSRLLTLGTPHRGAPKALAWLADGGPVPDRIARVLRRWPSTYELLPRYPVIMSDGKPQRPSELTIPGLDAGMVSDAYALHLAMDAGWDAIPEHQRPKIFSLYSYGHATLGRAELIGSRLRVTKDDPEWHAANNPRPLGDGTVPGLSAVPWQLEDSAHADDHDLDPNGTRHMALATPATIVEAKLRKWLNIPQEPVRGSEQPPVRVGLDLEDQHLAGEPIPIGARLTDVEPDDRTSFRAQVHRLSATGAPGNESVADPELTADGDWWRCEIDPLPPGSYRVTVEAARVPGRDNGIGTEYIAVLPSEDA